MEKYCTHCSDPRRHAERARLRGMFETGSTWVTCVSAELAVSRHAADDSPNGMPQAFSRHRTRSSEGMIRPSTGVVLRRRVAFDLSIDPPPRRLSCYIRGNIRDQVRRPTLGLDEIASDCGALGCGPERRKSRSARNALL